MSDISRTLLSLRIDPELVVVNTVILVPMLPSTDTDPGHYGHGEIR